MTGLRALLVLGLAQAGCAATSGQEWLNAPVDQQRAMLPPNVDTLESAPDPSPRLNHTVTLGESFASYPAPSRDAPVGAPAVQVNVPVVINNYAGYGYGYAVYGTRAFSAPVRATSSTSTSQKVGADFPKVPDFGPRAMR